MRQINRMIALATRGGRSTILSMAITKAHGTGPVGCGVFNLAALPRSISQRLEHLILRSISHHPPLLDDNQPVDQFQHAEAVCRDNDRCVAVERLRELADQLPLRRQVHRARRLVEKDDLRPRQAAAGRSQLPAFGRPKGCFPARRHSCRSRADGSTRTRRRRPPARAAMISSSVASGRAIRRFSLTVPENKSPVWPAMPTAVRISAGWYCLTSMPSISSSPAVGR